jgi:hypothetical protein
MLFVRVLEAGVWRTAPIGPDCEYEKTLVVSRVVGLWSVNRRSVEVFPGLILSFLEPEDAQFFRNSDVAALPFVEKGEIVAFECDDDAVHYVSQGLAEPLSQEEAQPLIDAAKAALEAKRDEMLKIRLENKTLTGLPTKAPPKKTAAAAPVKKVAASAPKTMTVKAGKHAAK